MSPYEYEGIDELQMRKWLINRRTMEGDQRSIDGARPTLGFPLGTALILLIVFGISALFSCCYRWEKFRSTHSRNHDRSSTTNSSSQRTARVDLTPAAGALPLSSAANSKNTPLHQSRSSLPVMMPGDDVPMFMAMPSPHGFAPQNIGPDEIASSHINQSN